MSTPLEVGPQGRIVIPSAIRKQMGIEVGSTLVASVVDGKLGRGSEGAGLRSCRSVQC
jgi:AbrB family looped-hinge helix DNA binding protein